LYTNFLAAGDPLAEAQHEAETGLEFATNIRFGLVIDCITAQLGLIRTLRGLTARFGVFNDERFDELRFECHLASAPPLALPECWYWIRKLQARFFAGDYPAAIEASLNTERLLWTSPAFFEVAEYHFYSALSRASIDSATDDARRRHFEALTAHQKQHEIWAENCPENFENRAALVGAEIARLEGRVLDAEQLYEQAIRSAHSNGFVNNEAIAYELAARFYAARGFQKFADSYLLGARYCYQRWGADGKVAQLDRLYPHLKKESSISQPTSTIVASTELLDLATVIKVSQAVSGEMVLEKLIDSLMRAAIEHAGAERGLLIIPRGDQFLIEAEATTDGNDVMVRQADAATSAAVLPESVVRYVVRTQENVIIEDASAPNPFSADPYVVQRRPRSILTLPLINQGKLIGILHLENNLTPHVFTPNRITVLKVLASQAAISLENTRLYRDLEDREQKIRRLVDANILGIFIWDFGGAVVEANEAFLHMLQYGREDVASGRLRWTDLTPPEWRERDEKVLTEVKTTGMVQPYEKEYFRKDGSRVPVMVAGALFEKGGGDGVGFGLDLSEQKRAELKLRRSERDLQEAQRLTHTGSWRYVVSSQRVTNSPEGDRIYDIQPDEDASVLEFYFNKIHPDHRKRVRELFKSCEIHRTDYQADYPIVLPDDTVKHIHAIGHPVMNKSGEIEEWVGTVMDVTEQWHSTAALEKAFVEIKELKDQLYKENLALRDEVDRASMFEEIVGNSSALQDVLSRIAKVAPTDSTVLITGETGTGKELIARALHKRSKRSGRAFVSVNCAALAPSLLSSELFGHEKGAFTGATQRRLGRFELADGGTIFLDEVGELPADTQVALLRVLQEREFERVGGTTSVQVNVRLIAATNRDLAAATASGTFRPDLFYRLNVFPIEVPPLRERKDDVLMLLEYFVKRYASKTGKNIRNIDKKTLDLFQSYDWPGNIRELQNVIERSVVLSAGDVFSVDQAWLSKEPFRAPSRPQASQHTNGKAPGEREIIEAALRESRGRVSGPSGAAAKLRIPASTLESKIKALTISKNQFKLL